MLNRYKIIGSFLLLSGVMLATGCKKVETPDPMGGAGTTIVKLPSEENYNIAFVELKSGAQTINLLELRRDIPNEGELNKTMKIVVKEDQEIINAYNVQNGTNYLALPATSYTADPANPKSGSTYTVSMAPGEFVKQLKVTFPNATVLDPNERYAVGLALVSADQGGKISEVLKYCLVEVGVKNKYDGHYEVTGSMVDLTSAALTGKYPFEADLETVDANTVLMYHTGAPFTGYYHPILNGTTVSAYGNYAVTIEFNENTIVDMYNGYGQGAGNRWGFLDATGVNTFDPATKTIKMKYTMNQPDAGTVRTRFNETFKYLGPR
jgi:hypothetical protein